MADNSTSRSPDEPGDDVASPASAATGPGAAVPRPREAADLAPEGLTVPPAPLPSGPPPGFAPPPYPVYPQPPSTPDAKRSRVTTWVVAGLVVVLMAGVLAGTVWWNARDDGKKKTAGFDATTEEFLGVFAHAAQQNVVRTRVESETSSSRKISELTMDYRTKRFTFAQETFYTAGPASIQSRCAGGRHYIWRTDVTGSGTWVPEDALRVCSLEFPYTVDNVNDGLNTGGLTQAQANAVVALLRKHPKLVKATKKTLRHDGKSYVEYSVKINPVDATPGSQVYRYQTGTYFLDAVKAQGINPQKHPYLVRVAGSEDGLGISYVVDPKTKLPVYARFGTTPPLDYQGKRWKDYDAQTWRVEYAFPEALPSDKLPTTYKTLTMRWSVNDAGDPPA